MTKKATQAQLEELHGEFAGYLKSYVTRARKIMDSADAKDDVQPNASTLNVIKGFLKDNGIEINGGLGQNPGDFDELSRGLDELPFQTDKFNSH